MTWRERWHRLIGVVRGDDGRVAQEIRFHRSSMPNANANCPKDPQRERVWHLTFGIEH